MHVPDLFDGRTFTTLEEGLGFVKEIGFEEVTARGIRAADDFSRDAVYAGFSLGVPAAQLLAQTREDAKEEHYFFMPVWRFCSLNPSMASRLACANSCYE